MIMKRTKELHQESIFVTEDDKKHFENYNRVMNQNAQLPNPFQNEDEEYEYFRDLEEENFERAMNSYFENAI